MVIVKRYLKKKIFKLINDIKKKKSVKEIQAK